MSPLSPELIPEAAPRVATFRRRVAEVDTAQWIRRGLPRVNGLPPVDVLARQAVDLRDDLRRYLRAQEARFVEYVRTHPPDLRPVDAGALAALPPQAVLTYHMWLDELVRSTEGPDRDDLARILRKHLREALGTGGEAARAKTGALPPGFGHLGQKEAAALLRTGLAKDMCDPGAQAFRKALADRAHQQAIQGAVLRDGAGRPVAAATFSTRGPALTVRNLGGLERVVPDAGLHMLRELAGLAAAKHKGLQMNTLAGSEAVLRELGFTQEADGRFTLSADSALALAQSAPGPSAAWTRAGWLEGPEATFEERLGPDRVWLLAQQQVPVRKAAGPETYATAVLMGTDGTLWAVAKYLMNAGARDLVVVSLWLNPGAPPTAARRIMRKMAEIAAKAHRGLTMTTAAAAGTGLAARLGMARMADGYGFTTQQAATFASGLTQGMSFAGCVSWELAVAGATEYLENIIIPGVVDTVSATTHKQLVDALVEGLAAGEGTNDLIARIRALDETAFGLVRAERIARTEAITANRAGAYQIALGSGASKKRWVSRLMPNTREWHREAHQQVVPIAEPFVVANRKGELEHLKFPGDRSLGAGPDNTIQCVCSALYLKPGVSDDATYEQYGAAGTTAAPGPVAAIAPEPVRKATVISLEELREFVAKDKGWAPGPNANWRRVDDAEPWRKDTRPAKQADTGIDAPCSGYQLDKALVTELTDYSAWTNRDDLKELHDELQSGGMLALEGYKTEFKGMAQEKLIARLVDDEEFLGLCGVSPDDAKYVREQAVGAKVRELVDTWATTSGDSNLKALLVQEAARQEFGLTDARTADLLDLALANDALDPNDPDMWTSAKYERYAATLESPEFTGYRSFVRAQYDETQAMLEKNGITEVLLYRGGSVPDGTLPAGLPDDDAWVAGNVRLKQNPLTSWSTDPAAAGMFVDSFSPDRDAAMFAAVVPAERILATPATGSGCLTEAEAIILGGETDAFTFVKEGGQRVYIHDALEAQDQGTLAGHELGRTALTEGAGDDED